MQSPSHPAVFAPAAGQCRYLEAHLLDALIDLRLAHPAHKARCQERVDALLHKMAEIA